jgi:hypothetical protein
VAGKINCYGAFRLRKKFFFEKKNQKTFAPGGFGGGVARAPGSRRFAAFFSEKAALASFKPRA